MTTKHPYASAPGHIVQVINHLRKSFPAPPITSDTLKKLGYAPKNESYILNILRFLGIIDQEGNKTESASKVFSLHDDAAFYQGFEKLVMSAYSDLFELHGDATWDLNTDQLITFFRSSDETTEVVGKRQASTFQVLTAFSGHGEVPGAKTSAPKPPAGATKKKDMKPKTLPTEKPAPPHADQAGIGKRDLGLTVRIEINLPADGDQETYDRIFKSIRENLLDG